MRQRSTTARLGSLAFLTGLLAAPPAGAQSSAADLGATGRGALPAATDPQVALGEASEAPLRQSQVFGAGPSPSGTSLPSGYVIEDPARHHPSLNKWVSVGIVGGLYIGFWTLCYEAWFASGTHHGFKWDEDGWFGSDAYAGGEDKVGHVFFPSLLTRATAGILREGGWDPVLSTVVGAVATNATYFVLETKDGTTTAFSYRDVVSNFLGTTLGVLMLHVPWLDERFDFRVEYFPSSGYLNNFRKEGFDFNEDYTGLKFMVAYHLSTIPPIEQWRVPLRFVDLVVGYNTQNYRPRPTPEDPVQFQRLFFGVSLNWQRIVDELWLGVRHPRFGDSAGPVHRVVQFASEHFTLPFTTLRLLTVEGTHTKQWPGGEP